MRTCAAIALGFLGLCLAEVQLKGDPISQNSISTEADTESTEVEDEAPETIFTKQTSQPDIHTVLKEINNELARQRVELTHTTTQLETRLRASESKAALLEKTVKEQRAVVSKLKEKQEQQSAAVVALGGQVTLTGSQVEELRREKEEKKVSFSVTLRESGIGSFGPFSAATPLIYKRVITNIGNCYNANTGAFTAPVKGVYSFQFAVYGDNAPRPTAASLHKNGDLIVIAYSHPGTFQMATNGASLLLEVGDVVQVKLWPGAWVYGNAGTHPTSFSGSLVFLM